MDLKESRSIAEKLFAEVRELTFDGVGVSRESYGARESATADYLRRFAADAGFALDYVKQHAHTPKERQAVCDALLFKTNVLWVQLDALNHASQLGKAAGFNRISQVFLRLHFFVVLAHFKQRRCLCCHSIHSKQHTGCQQQAQHHQAKRPLCLHHAEIERHRPRKLAPVQRDKSRRQSSKNQQHYATHTHTSS